MYLRAGMVRPCEEPSTADGFSAAERPDRPRSGLGGLASVNFVMGVASGMPCDAELLALLPRHAPSGAVWQTTLIGRAEVWPVHQKTAELGGMLRSGLEDTFYLPGGERARGNGELIDALATCARRAGRDIASPEQARLRLGLRAAATCA
jgi:uncharacterized protein (DUF849 family)